MSTGSGKGKATAVIRKIQAPTPREKFLVALAGGPIMPPDAVVMLCGEDWEPRMQRAIGRFLELRQWAITKNLSFYHPVIVLSGGVHEPPGNYSAAKITPKLIGQGVSHDRIIIDNDSQNTRDQAVNVVAMAVEKGWKRLMLVASPYHAPRSFLTFLKVLQEQELDRDIELLSDTSDHTPWFGAPDGGEVNRIDLLTSELTKIGQYVDHVASYEDGLAYLEYWETHEPEMFDGRAA